MLTLIDDASPDASWSTSVRLRPVPTVLACPF
jgi:hypothetical protein